MSKNLSGIVMHFF